MPITVIGWPELSFKLNALTKSMTTAEARRSFLAAARIIRDEARRQAPSAKFGSVWHGRKRYEVKPGLLKRSIISRAGRRQTAAAYTSVEVFRGPVRAQHAHLVEFGTISPRVPRIGKVLIFRGIKIQKGKRKGKISGSRYTFARRVGPMPANPFFARAIAAKGGQALDAAVVAAQKVIERRASK